MTVRGRSKHARRRANRQARESPRATADQLFRIWDAQRHARGDGEAPDAWLRLRQIHASNLTVMGPSAARSFVHQVVEHSIRFGTEFSRRLQRVVRRLGVPVRFVRQIPGGAAAKKRVVRTFKLGVAARLTTRRPPGSRWAWSPW